MKRKDNFTDWVGVSAAAAMSSCWHVDAECSCCCGICAAASGRMVFAICIRAMSRQVSHWAKFCAAPAANSFSGATAFCIIANGFVRSLYFFNPGRIKLIPMGNVNKFWKVNWVMG